MPKDDFVIKNNNIKQDKVPLSQNRNKAFNKKKVIIFSIISIIFFICIMCVSYFLIANSYENKFLPNTTIQNIDVSGLNIEEAANKISTQFNDSKTILKEDGYDDIIITGEQISLRVVNGDIENILSKQNKFTWFQNYFVKPDNISACIQYNENTVLELINNLDCVNEQLRSQPVSATIQYDATKQNFDVVKEIPGNLVDKNMLITAIAKAISNNGTIINISECYIQPLYTASSQEIITDLTNANRIINKQISFNIDKIPNAETLTKENLVSFILLDENRKLIANELNIQAWLKEMGKKYDTAGKPISFTTVYGKEISMPSGSYGWITDEQATLPIIIEALFNDNNNQIIDFKYQQECNSPKDIVDFGNKYIDLDITEQKVRLIENNMVINEFVCVTGTDTPNRRTSIGAWQVYFMAKDFLMVSEEKDKNGKPTYETPAKYFVGFHSGQGFHDADWRYNWRTNAWKYDGSHGCANMHGKDAEIVYNFAEKGMPVLVHM